MFDDFELLAELPAPRDDEPSSLRRDIADELADHLACAFHRELVKSGNAETARQRALDRFGDPRQVARTLWWQAMRNRIMSKWFWQATTAAALAVSMILLGLLWSRDQGLTDMLRTQQALLASQQQQLQTQRAELLQQVDRLEDKLARNTTQSTIPVTVVPETTTLKLQLWAGTEPGTPSRSTSVSLSGQDLLNQHLSTAMQGSYDEGVANFGEVLPGRYQVAVRTRHYHTDLMVDIARGEDRVETVFCPSTPEAAAEISPTLATDWPAEIQDRSCTFLAVFEGLPINFAERKWEANSNHLIVSVEDSNQRWLGDAGDQRRSSLPLPIDSDLRDASHRAQFLMRRHFELSRTAGSRTSPTYVERMRPHLQAGTPYQATHLLMITNADVLRAGSFSGRGTNPANHLVPVVAYAKRGDPNWPESWNPAVTAEPDSSWTLPFPETLLSEARRQFDEAIAQRSGTSPADGLKPINSPPQ